MPYCPICGQECKGTSVIAIPGGDYPAYPQHRCPVRTLRGIDSAMGRREPDERQPSFGQRLRDGMRMLDGESI